jgi:predicted O-methyltransferase YrrM
MLRSLLRGIERHFSAYHHLRALAAQGTPAAEILERVVLLSSRRRYGQSGDEISAIEREREKFRQRHEPLADGSLGQIGPYDEKTVAEACKASRRPASAAFLHLLIREFRSGSVIELGTNLGISGAYLATALRVTGQGVLHTLEASPYRQREAKRMHSMLGLSNVRYHLGYFEATLSSVLDKMGTVDFAFIDGHHQYQPTLEYFDRIWESSTEGAVFVFDDIRWTSGMSQAWEELRVDPRMVLVTDYISLGVCITTRAPGSTPTARLPAVRLL